MLLLAKTLREIKLKALLQYRAALFPKSIATGNLMYQSVQAASPTSA